MPKSTQFPPAAPTPEQPWNPKDVVKTSDLAQYAKTSDVMAKAESITGYDKTKAQTLQHDDTGALTWVDNE